MSKKNELWKAFYTEEKSFFDFLNAHTTALYQMTDCAPVYIDRGQSRMVAPSYVRSLRAHNGNLSAILAQAEVVKQCYVLAKAYDSGISADEVKPHHRALQYVGHIDSATLSTTNAHRSTAIKHHNENEVVIYRHWLPHQAELSDLIVNHVNACCCTLKEHGLQSAAVNKVGIKKVSMQLTVSQQDLLDYFDAEDLSVREYSGTQYIADLSYSSQDRPIKRTNFGLLLTDNPKAQMLMARPRKKRSNALERMAEQVFLPIATSYEFFKKR